jgi:hypothetical protein
MLVDGARPVLTKLRPGTYVMIAEPGEKPSFLLTYFVATCTALLLVGSRVDDTLSIRSVGELDDGTVKALLGHGSRQWCPPGLATKVSHVEMPGSLESVALARVIIGVAIMDATTTLATTLALNFFIVPPV